MNKFNLTFSGQIKSDKNPDEVRKRFEQWFHINNPARVDRFFTGDKIILRRNLERKEAAQYFRELDEIGMVAELEKIPPHEVAQLEEAEALRRKQQQQAKDDAKRHREALASQLARQKRAEQQRAAETEAARLASAKKAREKAETDERERRAREAAAARELERQAAKKALDEERAAQARKKQEQRDKQRALKSAARQRAAQEKTRQAELKAARKAAREQARAEKRRAKEAQKKARAAAELEASEQAKQKAREAADARSQQDEREKQALIEEQVEEARRATQSSGAGNSAPRPPATIAPVTNEPSSKATPGRASALPSAQQGTDSKRGQQQPDEKTIADDSDARPKGKRGRPRAKKEASDLVAINAASGGAADTLEEQAIARGAAELSRGLTAAQRASGPKTRLQVPQQAVQRRSNNVTEKRRRRQPGEPNLYELKPFRMRADVKQRGQVATDNVRRGVLALAACGMCLALLIAARVWWQAAAPVSHIEGVASDNLGTLYLLAGGKLYSHDRAGNAKAIIEPRQLGLSTLVPPIMFTADDRMLLAGTPLQSPEGADLAPLLMSCETASLQCNPGMRQGVPEGSYTLQPHPLDDTIFLLDANAGTLERRDATGNIVASAAIPVSPTPAMQLASGLLFANGAEAPAIGVFRYDETAFGEQIDNVLLLNPSGAATQRDRVGDFIYHKGNWWVVLYAQQSKDAAVYLFDSQWNFLRELALGPQDLPISLHPWGDKVLVNAGNDVELLRVNAAGDLEAPFTPTLLAQSVDTANARSRWLDLTWRSAVAGTVILSILAGLWTYLQRLRSVVYRTTRGRGAQPIDDYLDSLKWLPPEVRRGNILRRHQRVVAVLAVIGIATLIAGGLAGAAVAALALTALGVILALNLQARHPFGHIARLDKRLLLVDHRKVYHIGQGSEIQYRGRFVIIYDVVVFCGNWLVPNFESSLVARELLPVVTEGVKIDRRTLIVKLIQSRHPLFTGAAIVGCALLVSLLAVLV